MVKIAFIHNRFPAGGAERVTIDVARYLHRFEGYKVYVYASRIARELLTEEMAEVFVLREIPKQSIPSKRAKRIEEYVVEDGIMGQQLDGSLTVPDYYHQYVVRKMLSATVYGDGMGRIAPGAVKSRTYEVSLDAAWNLANTYVYALAIDADGYVNNMQVCLLNGGSADYEYLPSVISTE